MRVSVLTMAALALAVLSPHAHAAPSAPVVTVGADLKLLQFDWEQVPASNWYELWFKANDGAPWIEYTQIPAARTARIRIGVSIHLLDWRIAKYHVAACNPSGCTSSADVGVSELANDAIGYLKSQVSNSRRFGIAVAASADGGTLAVVNGETFGTSALSATVYVYRRTSSTAWMGGWRREARLLPSMLQAGTATGAQLSLSGDGNVLALGLDHEDLHDTSRKDDAGAVYLFRRSGSTWQLEQKLTGAVRAQNLFGRTLDLDDAGRTLVVGRDRDDAGNVATGTTDIYLHGTGGWQLTQTVPAPIVQTQYDGCRGMALSGDGHSLVISCNSSGFPQVLVYSLDDGTTDSGAPASIRTFVDHDGSVDVNYDGTRLAIRTERDWASVYAREDGQWQLDGDLLDIPGIFSGTHNNIAISRDGKFVAVAGSDDLSQSGPIYPPLIRSGLPDPTATDSVYLYERRGWGWNMRRVLKPAVHIQGSSYGASVALCGDGHVLIVGSPDDSSAATGIGGDPLDTSSPDRGAAWLY